MSNAHTNVLASCNCGPSVVREPQQREGWAVYAFCFSCGMAKTLGEPTSAPVTKKRVFKIPPPPAG